MKDYIAVMPGWKQGVARRINALIARMVPGVRKAAKWYSPFNGIEDRGYYEAAAASAPTPTSL